MIIIVNHPPHLQAHVHLNHFQMSVSPTATLSKIDDMAHAFDSKVLQWKAGVEQHHLGMFNDYSYYNHPISTYYVHS